MRKTYGKNTVTPFCKEILLDNRKNLLSFFSIDLMSFEDKKAESKYPTVYCTDVVAFTKFMLLNWNVQGAVDHIIGVDGGKDVLKEHITVNFNNFIQIIY